MAADTSRVVAHSCTAVNITTSGYVELIAATSTLSASRLEIVDTSGKIIKLATGPAGSEVDICTNVPSGDVLVPFYLPPAVRVSAKAVDASATSGYLVVSLLG